MAIHRTYLADDGSKANVRTVRKVVGSLPPSSAVRLFKATSTIGIAEGIETALSASLQFDLPVWAAISACGIERWTPPTGVDRVIVFGDNDLSGTGQSAAWNLAKRLMAIGIEVEVKIPEIPGRDWNDVFTGKLAHDKWVSLTQITAGGNTAIYSKDALPTLS